MDTNNYPDIANKKDISLIPDNMLELAVCGGREKVYVLRRTSAVLDFKGML